MRINDTRPDFFSPLRQEKEKKNNSIGSWAFVYMARLQVEAILTRVKNAASLNPRLFSGAHYDVSPTRVGDVFRDVSLMD